MDRKLKRPVNRKRLIKESLSDVEDKAKEVQNPVYADAIRGIKRADKAREEYRKLPKAEVREEKPKFKGTQAMKKMHLSESLFEDSDFTYEGDYIVRVNSYNDGVYESDIQQCTNNQEAAAWFDELNQMTDDKLAENGIDGFAWLTVDDDGTTVIVDERISGYADTEAVQREIDYYVNTKQQNESLKSKSKIKNKLKESANDTEEKINDLFFSLPEKYTDMVNSIDSGEDSWGHSSWVFDCTSPSAAIELYDLFDENGLSVSKEYDEYDEYNEYGDYDEDTGEYDDEWDVHGNEGQGAFVYIDKDDTKELIELLNELKSNNKNMSEGLFDDDEEDDSEKKAKEEMLDKLNDLFFSLPSKYTSKVNEIESSYKKFTFNCTSPYATNFIYKLLDEYIFVDKTIDYDGGYVDVDESDGDTLLDIFNEIKAKSETKTRSTKSKVESLNESTSNVDINKLSNFIKNAVNGLTKNDEGTWYFHLVDNLYYVIGAVNPENYDKEDLKILALSKDGWVICGKIAVNIDDMQSDYELDWYMPYEKDGEVWDTERDFYKNDDYTKVAQDIIRDLHNFDNVTVDKNGEIITNKITDEACKSKKRVKKQLKEDSEIHVFDQIPDEEIYDQADYVFSDDGLYGKDYTDGLIIGGNRDYSSIIYSKEHKDEIKDLLYSGYSSDEIVQELNKITGKTYVADQISGYSQSDWNNVYYPTGEFSNDYIRGIEDAYFGKYTAYDDGNELVVVFDSDRRPVKEIISDQTGIPVNQIKIRKFTGYTRTPNYEDDED